MKHADLQRTLRLYAKFIFWEEKSLLCLVHRGCLKYFVHKSRRAVRVLLKSLVFFWFSLGILAINLILLMALHYPAPNWFTALVGKCSRWQFQCAGSFSLPYTCQLSLFSLAATVNYIFAIIYVLFTLLLLYGVGPRVFFSSSRRILTFTVRYLSVDITGTYFRYNNQLIYYQILFQEVNLSLCSHPGCLGIGVATLFFFLGDEVGCFLHRYLRIRTQLALCVLSYRFPSPNSFNLLDFGDSLFSEWPYNVKQPSLK